MDSNKALSSLVNDVIVTAVVLMVGAPPPHPETKDRESLLGLVEFGTYIHELAEWTTAAKVELFKLWDISETTYGESATYRCAFDEFLKHVYVLKREDY